METAAQMRDAVLSRAADKDIIIAAAAVADYTPRQWQIRRSRSPPAHGEPEEALLAPQNLEAAGRPQIVLTETDDILARLGAQKRPGQVLVGFAAETENVLEHARRKLESKNLDWIVANDVSQPGAGFDVDTNIVTLLGARGRRSPCRS